MEYDKEKILDLLKEHYPLLAKQYGLNKIGLFGSFSKGCQTPSSDIDLVAEFDHPIGLKFVEFSEQLEKILGHSTDILTPTGIQMIRNEEIKNSILQSIIYV